MTPEGKVKEAIKGVLRKEGAFFFQPVSNGMGTHGVHDIISCLPVEITPDMVGEIVGVFFSIEAKAPGKRGHKNRGATELQMSFLNRVARAGGLAMIADSSAEVKEFITAVRTGVVPEEE